MGTLEMASLMKQVKSPSFADHDGKRLGAASNPILPSATDGQ